MKLALSSPVVTLLPGQSSPWEYSAGIKELAAIATHADRLGYHHMSCSEHVAVPTQDARQRGGTYWDPLPTFGHLAAHTSKLHFATKVLVLGYHHPLAIAKRYGTLDQICHGRLILGFGVGSLEPEFELLGAPFQDRGPRADEALTALRAALGQRTPQHHGSYYNFEGLEVSPNFINTTTPFWIGGRTRRSLRRALAYGNGWAPFALDPATITTMLADVELPAGFEIVLTPDAPLDPINTPQQTHESLLRLGEAGATIASVRLTATDAEHYQEQMAALQELSHPSA